MPRQIKKNSTDISLYFFIQDSSDGSPETGVTITDLDLQYVRFGAAPSAKVDATALAATDSAHGDNQAIEIDATDQPGLYRVDWPDAAFATGVNGVILTVKGTGFQPAHMEIELVNTLASDIETDTQDIQSRLPAALVSGRMSSDMVAVSGDATAADNLELQFDTTGVVGDTFPATQAQLAGIANVGSAISITADSYTLTTGTQSSGTVASTNALDGTNHEHTDDAGAMDLYYEFIIGSGIPTSVTMTGYLNGNNDDLEIYGYDWVAAGWVRIGTLAGKTASTNEVDSYDMFVNMVGSGANEGKVRVRFTDGAFTLTTATLAIDQIFLSYSRGAKGYDNGAIWIDTTVSNTNTVVGIDGTARNPVSTIAAANTLSASTNLNRFEVAPGSSITFAASQDDQVFNGMNWTLALGGQSVSGSHITGASVSGICTGATPPSFTNCHFGATTLPPSQVDHSNFLGTLTAGSAGDFFLDRCHSGIAGTSTPVFDFGSGLAASNLNLRGYSGGIEIQNMGAGAGTYNMSLEGDGALVINANCSATSNISLRGNFNVTDNAGGAVTVTTDDDTTNIVTIAADVVNIDGDAMRGTDGANTTVPDAAGTAAGLHATTDGLIGALTVPDAAGTAAALHATTDGKVDAIQTDLGDFSGRTNNQSLLAVLGVPDVAAKDLHTLLVTDRLDHATYGLSAIEALVDDLETRLTAVRAGYLDELAAANIPADVDTLLSRLSAARAGYLDELAAANIPADIDTLIARLTAARATNLDELGATNIPADIDSLLGRLTAARAGYLDKLNVSGALAHSDAAATYKADVSALALEATVATLNDPTAAAIATAVMAKVVDGTIDVTECLTILLAVLAGDMTKSSDTYTHEDQAGVTKVTSVVSASAVERTIA